MLKKIYKLISSSVLSQIILVASTPILASMYSPFDFGYFGLALAFCTILSQTIGLRIEQSILVSSSDLTKIKLALSFSIAICLSFLVFLPLSIIYGLKFALVVTLMSFGSYCFVTINIYYTKVGKIVSTSILMIIRAVLIVFFQLILSNVIMLGSNGLILGYTLGVIFSPILILRELEFTNFNINDFKYILKSRVNYIKYNLPQSILNNIGSQMPVFAIEIIWGKESLGYYTMAMKVVQLPVRFVGNAIRSILTPVLSEKMKYNNSALSLVKRSSLYLLIMSFILFSIMYFVVKPVFNYVLGNAWETSADLVQVLILWFSVSLFNIPSICFLVALDKLKLLFYMELTSLIIKLFIFTLPLFFVLDLESVLFAYSFFMFLLNIALIYYSCFRLRCNSLIKKS